MAARIAIIAITTSSSIKVDPHRLRHIKPPSHDTASRTNRCSKGIMRFRQTVVKVALCLRQRLRIQSDVHSGLVPREGMLLAEL